MLWFSCALLPCEETQYVMFLEIHMCFYGSCSNGTLLTMYFTCVLQVCKHPRPVQDSHYSSLADPPEILHTKQTRVTRKSRSKHVWIWILSGTILLAHLALRVSAMTYFYGIYHYSFVNISKLIFCLVTAVYLHIPFLYTKGDFSVLI